MKRRDFLKHLVAGGAVLTTLERSQLEDQIQAPPSDDPGDDRHPYALNWHQSVRRREDLPADALEGDAVYVESWYAAFVYVQGAGWLQMTTLSGGIAG